MNLWTFWPCVWWQACYLISSTDWYADITLFRKLRMIPVWCIAVQSFPLHHNWISLDTCWQCWSSIGNCEWTKYDVLGHPIQFHLSVDIVEIIMRDEMNSRDLEVDMGQCWDVLGCPIQSHGLLVQWNGIDVRDWEVDRGQSGMSHAMLFVCW